MWRRWSDSLRLADDATEPAIATPYAAGAARAAAATIATSTASRLAPAATASTLATTSTDSYHGLAFLRHRAGFDGRCGLL